MNNARRPNRRIYTADQMRGALRRMIRASGLTQAQFARKRIGELPTALNFALLGRRGLSSKEQRFLGVRREIVYRFEGPK